MKNKHLTYEDRIDHQEKLTQGESFRKIASSLDKSPQPFRMKSRSIAKQFKQNPMDVYLMVVCIVKTACASGCALPVAIKIQRSSVAFANTAMKLVPTTKERIASS